MAQQPFFTEWAQDEVIDGQRAAKCGKLRFMKKTDTQKTTQADDATSDESAQPRARILVLQGPNLNMLGVREPSVYGRTSLVAIHCAMEDRARASGVQLESFQSNHEGELIDRIQAAYSEGVDFIIINPAGFGHTSVALRDALAAVAIPFVEVHISNVHAREPFRHQTYLSAIAVGVICGLGPEGYQYALEFALSKLLAR